jgi:hypothetical protein
MEPEIFSNKHQTAKIILIILAMAVVGFSIWVWRTQVELNKQNSNVIDNQKKPEYQTRLKVNTKEYDKTQTPPGMPADLPIETGAEFVNSFTANAVTGPSQATRVYYSKKSFTDLESDFSVYLKNNGWKVFPTTKSKTYWVISASKDSAIFNVKLTSISTDKILVELTFVPAINKSK